MNDRFFEGLKILDFASVLAGPLAGSFFAELGADVIKVENPVTGGDVTRKWKLTSESYDAPVSAYYASANYGKKVLWADLNDIKQKALIREELQQADGEPLYALRGPVHPQDWELPFGRQGRQAGGLKVPPGPWPGLYAPRRSLRAP